MHPIETRILQVLKDLTLAVQSMRASGLKQNLLPYFGQIDALTKQLPRETEPQLLHYLHKQSYEKARLWLEGREAENVQGSCGH